MTCGRVFYGLLAALFAYVTVTVAAFVYLQWWQAILASAVTLGVIVVGAKFLIKTAIGRIGQQFLGAMTEHAKTLKDAEADVHSVRHVPPPADLEDEADDPDADELDRAEAAADLRTLRWFEVELSVFPNREKTDPADTWAPGTLTLVRHATKPPSAQGFAGLTGDDDTNTFDLRDLRVLVDGEPMDPDEEVSGPQRLRFLAGVPTGVKALALRYVVHQFGRIDLPATALPPRKT